MRCKNSKLVDSYISCKSEHACVRSLVNNTGLKQRCTVTVYNPHDTTAFLFPKIAYMRDERSHCETVLLILVRNTVFFGLEGL